MKSELFLQFLEKGGNIALTVAKLTSLMTIFLEVSLNVIVKRFTIFRLAHVETKSVNNTVFRVPFFPRNIHTVISLIFLCITFFFRISKFILYKNA